VHCIYQSTTSKAFNQNIQKFVKNAKGRAGEGAGGGVPLPHGGSGVAYHPRKFFSILDVHTCILECRDCILVPFTLDKFSQFKYRHVHLCTKNIANLLKTNSNMEN